MYLTMARILRFGPIIIRNNKDVVQYANISMPSKKLTLTLQLMICIVYIKKLGSRLNRCYDEGYNESRE